MNDDEEDELAALGARAEALHRDTVAFLERMIQRDGDIRTTVVHHMATLGLDHSIVKWVRQEHFRKLGRRPPRQPGPRDLE